MRTLRLRFVVVMLVALLGVTGCGDDNGSGSVADLNRIEADVADALRTAVDRFEHAERNFGPSTNYDVLIQNEHWLNRMQEALVEASQVEDSAIRMGLLSTPSNLRVALMDRVQHRYQTLMNDKRQIEIATDYEIALDILRD